MYVTVVWYSYYFYFFFLFFKSAWTLGRNISNGFWQQLTYTPGSSVVMTFTCFAPSQASNFALFPPTSSEYSKKQFSYHPLSIFLINDFLIASAYSSLESSGTGVVLYCLEQVLLYASLFLVWRYFTKFVRNILTNDYIKIEYCTVPFIFLNEFQHI